jgi:hypothetical protein
LFEKFEIMIDEKQSNSRREFLKTTLTGVTALTILPSNVIASLGRPMPSDKLNIAAIGVGGVGFRNLNNLKNENIVALCDVDWEYGQKAFRRWPNSPKYKDFRLMLENEKNIDAVVIATPDHSHAIAAMSAMQLRKHVFVQAPMAHSVFELRRIVETAKIFDVSTQVGNQIASSDFSREISETIWAGIIGEIREVFVWTSEPGWIQGEELPDKKMIVPRNLDWDLFVGPSAFIPYHPAFTPYGWRAWWKFGNGALGAAGPHLLEPVFRALKLKSPMSVEASSTYYSLDSAPKAERILFEFKKRDNLPDVAMPSVKIHWLDGGLLPEFPEKLPAEISLKDFTNGIFFMGSDGMIIANTINEKFQIVKNGEVISFDANKVIHRIENSTGGHETDWVRSCKESPSNRLQCSASFESQAPMTETLLVGTLALRLQSLGKKLFWDSSQMKFSNIDIFEEFEISSPRDFRIENGIATINGSSKKYNAAHFVDQTVRPIFRENWKQI